MNKDLKKFIKQLREEFGDDCSTTLGVQNFYRRMKAAVLIANDLFGDKADNAVVMTMYEQLIKEEIGALWLEKAKTVRKSKGKKGSVIADVGGEIVFDLKPKKMSN